MGVQTQLLKIGRIIMAIHGAPRDRKYKVTSRIGTRKGGAAVLVSST